jgi:hypothetical protein
LLPLKLGLTKTRRCIKKELKDYNKAIDYCNVQSGGVANYNTYYYVNIAPDDIIVPKEFNECLW